MDGGAWWAAVHGVTKSRTRLSDFPFTFHFHALEKAMAAHSSVLAWRIPGTGEPGGLPSMGSHRVRHDWSDLAAAAAAAENKIIRFYWSTAVFYVLVCLYRLGWKLLNNREHVGDNKHHEEKQGRVSSWSVILGCTVGEPSLRWWCWVHLDEVKM